MRPVLVFLHRSAIPLDEADLSTAADHGQLDLWPNECEGMCGFERGLALPLELVTNSEAHDAWFRAKVREALEDTRPDIPDDQLEAHFAERRAAARRKARDLKS